jgi:hypothetical protein
MPNKPPIRTISTASCFTMLKTCLIHTMTRPPTTTNLHLKVPKTGQLTAIKKKLNDIARVIIAAGGWNAPAVVGLCEIENFQVLLDLTTNTPLKPLGYQIVHENSKDTRGIDVALLYRADKVKKLKHQLIRLEEEAWTTRDILQVKNADKPNRHHRFLCEPLAITLRRQRGDTGKKDSHGHFAEKSH